MTSTTNLANLNRRKASLERKIERQRDALESMKIEYQERIDTLQAELTETNQQIQDASQQ